MKRDKIKSFENLFHCRIRVYVIRYLAVLVFLFFPLFPMPAAASESGSNVNNHGLLIECDDKTRENHLYLMNAEKLGLSREQIEKLRKIKGECDNHCIIDRARLRVAKKELNELLSQEDMDLKKAEEKIKEISALQDRLRLRHLKAKIESMMILNDQQKEKAKTLAGN